MKVKTFYRVSNILTGQGLWYNINGEFTGLIHTDFNFCENSELKMPYDEELIGYMSVASSLDILWKWFNKDDIRKLQLRDYYIHEYEATDYKFYELFQHDVINKETSILTKRIILL